MFLVGNKTDLTESRAVPLSSGQFKKQEIRQCVMFKETSAHNDVDSILQLFNEIGIAIVRQGKYQNNRNSKKLD